MLNGIKRELTYKNTHLFTGGGDQRSERTQKPQQAQGEQANSKQKGPASGRHVNRSSSQLSHLKAFLGHCLNKNETDGQLEKMMPPATAGASKDTKTETKKEKVTAQAHML